MTRLRWRFLAAAGLLFLAAGGGLCEEAKVRGVVSGPPDRRYLRTEEGDQPLANPERLSALPVGARVVVVGEREGKRLRVRRVRPLLVEAWERGQKDLFPIDKEAFRRLDRSVTALGAAVEEASQSGGLGAPGDEQDKAYTAIINGLVLAFKQLGEDDGLTEQQRALCNSLVEYLATQRAHRRVNDNFPPQVYATISQTAAQAVGVAKRGNPVPHGSGVLIGRNLVLTCRHNVEGLKAGEALEAWFGFDGQAAARYPVEEVIDHGWLSRRDEPLDFALLRLGRDRGGKAASDTRAAAQLTLREPRWGDPVYAVGHPEAGALLVHDNAYVRFPWRLGADEFLRLKMLVLHEVDEAPARLRKPLLDEFKNSYRRAPKEGPYEYFSERFQLHPAIGVDTATYHGDSGGPLFDRHTGRLVGIIFAGRRETDPPNQPGWRFHEVAVPVSVIVAALDGDAKLRNWRQDYEVKIHDAPKTAAD